MDTTTSAASTATQIYAQMFAGSKATTKSELGKNDFMLLLLEQLKNQDPTKPMEDTEFIAQLAQFNSLEQMQSLNNTMFDLLVLQQVNEANTLIGKTITAQPASETEPVTGKVTGFGIIKGEVTLQVGEKSVSLRDLLTVSEGT